ncbi:MAG: methyltransferase domain-containing protein [Acidimicrobiales bacterium]|nr:methyltransferase domain-containing protein [Acidimicrobiales bacterium]
MKFRERARQTAVKAGWSRTPVPITPEMLVVELRSGACANPRADVLCDRPRTDDRRHASLPIAGNRPTVYADMEALPFATGAIDFLISSRLAVQVTDPDQFCREVGRVARAGFIETPSPLADLLMGEAGQRWRATSRGEVLEFRRKRPKPRVVQGWRNRLCKVFFAEQPSGARPTVQVPTSKRGRVRAWLSRAIGAGLHRSGLMHTRVLFTPGRPLQWLVKRPGGATVMGVAGGPIHRADVVSRDARDQPQG